MADREYTGQAIGIFELDGLLACYVALDAAAKAANITVQGVERNRLKSGACVKIRGGVADVRAALDAALAAAVAGSRYINRTEVGLIAQE